MKLIKTDGYIGTDEGRLYLDGMSLEWNCPKCNMTHTLKLNRDSYMYDCIENGKDKVFELNCRACDSEFQFTAKLNIDFVIASDLV